VTSPDIDPAGDRSALATARGGPAASSPRPAPGTDRSTPSASWIEQAPSAAACEAPARLVAQAVEVLLTRITCSRQQAVAVLRDVAHDRGMTLQSYAALVVERTSGTGPPGLTQPRDLTSLELSASRNARKCLSCGMDAATAVAVPAITHTAPGGGGAGGGGLGCGGLFSSTGVRPPQGET
jgi:hypothetical protein